jgi:hypothetical protein
MLHSLTKVAQLMMISGKRTGMGSPERQGCMVRTCVWDSREGDDRLKELHCTPQRQVEELELCLGAREKWSKATGERRTGQFQHEGSA